MAEQGTARQRDKIVPPMETADYRLTARSHLMRVIFSAVVAAVVAWLSLSTDIPVGFIPMLFIGLGFAYGISGKLFPDSDQYFSLAAKNFRRVRRGLEPLGEDQSRDVSYFDEFRKG